MNFEGRSLYKTRAEAAVYLLYTLDFSLVRDQTRAILNYTGGPPPSTPFLCPGCLGFGFILSTRFDPHHPPCPAIHPTSTQGLHTTPTEKAREGGFMDSPRRACALFVWVCLWGYVFFCVCARALCVKNGCPVPPKRVDVHTQNTFPLFLWQD